MFSFLFLWWANGVFSFGRLFWGPSERLRSRDPGQELMAQGVEQVGGEGFLGGDLSPGGMDFRLRVAVSSRFYHGWICLLGPSVERLE